MKKCVFFFLFLAVIAGMALAGLSGLSVAAYIGADHQAEAEYYRGIYDICAAQTHRREMCLGSVAQFRDRDWYGQESVGWEWPLVDDERRP